VRWAACGHECLIEHTTRNAVCHSLATVDCMEVIVAEILLHAAVTLVLGPTPSEHDPMLFLNLCRSCKAAQVQFRSRIQPGQMSDRL
jgi:hypothetical protein